MKVSHFEQVPAQPVEVEGATGCCVRWLISKTDGAPNFAMRVFELSAGGSTPKHQHAHEHEVFVLEGEGVVVENETEHVLKPGYFVYVEPGVLHQFRNTGNGVMRLLCMIPNSGDTRPV